DFAIADAHDVGQSVAGDVGKRNRFGAVGENQPGALLLVEYLAHAQPRPKSGLRKGGVPGEHIILADQDVGLAVAGEIDEFQVGVIPVQYGQRGERLQRAPGSIFGSLEEAWGPGVELDQIELPIAGKIEQLLSA